MTRHRYLPLWLLVTALVVSGCSAPETEYLGRHIDPTWVTELPTIHGVVHSAVSTEDHVLVRTAHGATVLDRDNGEVVWSQPDDYKLGAPEVHVYRNTVITATHSGYQVWDLATGDRGEFGEAMFMESAATEEVFVTMECPSSCILSGRSPDGVPMWEQTMETDGWFKLISDDHGEVGSELARPAGDRFARWAPKRDSPSEILDATTGEVITTLKPATDNTVEPTEAFFTSPDTFTEWGRTPSGQDAVTTYDTATGQELWTHEVDSNLSERLTGGAILVTIDGTEAVLDARTGDIRYPPTDQHSRDVLAVDATHQYSSRLVDGQVTVSAHNMIDDRLTWSVPIIDHALHSPSMGYVGLSASYLVWDFRTIPTSNTVVIDVDTEEVSWLAGDLTSPRYYDDDSVLAICGSTCSKTSNPWSIAYFDLS